MLVSFYFSYLTANNNQNFLYTARPFLKRAALVISYVSTSGLDHVFLCL